MEAPPTCHGHRARLRQRFEKTGFQGFAPHEVLELILTLCLPRRDVKQQAHTLIERFGSLRGVLDADIEALKKTTGLGTVAPTALKIVRETVNLYLQQKVEAQETAVLDSDAAIADFWRTRLGHLRNEVFEVALLDTHHRLIKDGVKRMSEGTVNRSVVYPRQIIEWAVKHTAAALVLAHNHPGGNHLPSDADTRFTQDLTTAAHILGIEVIDHYIITEQRCTSMRALGLL